MSAARKFINKHWIWIPAAAVVVIILFPVLWIITSSITPLNELFTSPIHYIPINPTLENYQTLFKNVDIGLMLKDTLIVSFFSVTLTLLFSLLAAYGFSHTKSKAVKITYALLIASSFLPGMSTIMPMFELFSDLKLSDTHFALILLYINQFIPFTVLILTTFMSQIPSSLEEAARVDGAGTLTVVFKILMPVMKPAITTMCIINFILSINEFMTPLIFTTSKVSILSVGITMIPRISQYQMPWDGITALATIMLIPIILFVVIFEKNIMSGIMAGSIKQ